MVEEKVFHDELNWETINIIPDEVQESAEETEQPVIDVQQSFKQHGEIELVSEEKTEKAQTVNEEGIVPETCQERNEETQDETSDLKEEIRTDSNQGREESPENDVPDNLSMNGLQQGLTELQDYIVALNARVGAIAETEVRTSTEIRELHKLYHTEYAGRLKKMQDELEAYRKVDQGRVFDDILSSIARIYDNYETLPDEVEEPKVKKSVKYFLMDLLDILETYNVSPQKTVMGETRDFRHCKVEKRLDTDDSAKHNTVAKSYNTGFRSGNRTIIPERVDVYYHNPKKHEAEEVIQEETNQIVSEMVEIPSDDKAEKTE